MHGVDPLVFYTPSPGLTLGDEFSPAFRPFSGCFDIASTGGNISVGPYSSTAVRLVVASGLTRGRSVDL